MTAKALIVTFDEQHAPEIAHHLYQAGAAADGVRTVDLASEDDDGQPVGCRAMGDLVLEKLGSA